MKSPSHYYYTAIIWVIGLRKRHSHWRGIVPVGVRLVCLQAEELIRWYTWVLSTVFTLLDRTVQ